MVTLRPYQPERFAARLAAESVIACIGGALVLGALAADQRWLDRHFLPAFFVSRHLYVLVESVLRIFVAAVGIAVAFLARPRIGSFIARQPARAFQLAIAAVLAVGASELILRRLPFRAVMEEPASMEPRRQRDPRLGWRFVPARTGSQRVGGRIVEYAFDSAGYRVRHVDGPVDPKRPTILFAGESMMVGEGLTWEETIPAQTGAMLGMQSANLAISGFASDQAYMRLQAELPRFGRPVAIVTVFGPALFDRNLDDDRPHLGPGLVWLPAENRWRLAAIGRLLIRYRSDEEVERGIATTREVLRATAELARARGAVPLVVVPEFAPEEPRETALRRRILDEAGVPYIRVALDPTWRIPSDGHPNAFAAHVVAAAVAARLQEH